MRNTSTNTNTFVSTQTNVGKSRIDMLKCVSFTKKVPNVDRERQIAMFSGRREISEHVLMTILISKIFQADRL